jgi:hypothetical protein
VLKNKSSVVRSNRGEGKSIERKTTDGGNTLGKTPLGENTTWEKTPLGEKHHLGKTTRSYHAHFGGIPIVVVVDVRQWKNVVDQHDVAPPQFFAWVHGVFLKDTVQRTWVQFAWEEAEQQNRY